MACPGYPASRQTLDPGRTRRSVAVRPTTGPMATLESLVLVAGLTVLRLRRRRLPMTCRSCRDGHLRRWAGDLRITGDNDGRTRALLRTTPSAVPPGHAGAVPQALATVGCRHGACNDHREDRQRRDAQSPTRHRSLRADREDGRRLARVADERRAPVPQLPKVGDRGQFASNEHAGAGCRALICDRLCCPIGEHGLDGPSLVEAEDERVPISGPEKGLRRRR